MSNLNFINFLKPYLINEVGRLKLINSIYSNLNYGYDTLYVEKMWKKTKGLGIKVAIMDSGIDVSHPNLSPNIVGGFDATVFSSYDGLLLNIKDYIEERFQKKTKFKPGDWYFDFDKRYNKAMQRSRWGFDSMSHGTHCAGIVAARPTIIDRGKKISISGIAPFASLYSVKIVERQVTEKKVGNTVQREESFRIQKDSINAAIDWCIYKKIDVISCSFGGAMPSDGNEEFFQKAHEAGIVVVCSAGNSQYDEGDFREPGNRVDYPAKYPNTIAVGSLRLNYNPDPTKRPYSFNPKNPFESSLFSSAGPEVDFAAPGDNIWSTIPVRMGSYACYSGTSMAAPFISGVVALIQAENKARTKKTLTPSEVYEVIRQGCVNVGDPGKDIFTGHGFFTFDKLRYLLSPFI